MIIERTSGVLFTNLRHYEAPHGVVPARQQRRGGVLEAHIGPAADELQRLCVGHHDVERKHLVQRLAPLRVTRIHRDGATGPAAQRRAGQDIGGRRHLPEELGGQHVTGAIRQSHADCLDAVTDARGIRLYRDYPHHCLCVIGDVAEQLALCDQAAETIAERGTAQNAGAWTAQHQAGTATLQLGQFGAQLGQAFGLDVTPHPILEACHITARRQLGDACAQHREVTLQLPVAQHKQRIAHADRAAVGDQLTSEEAIDAGTHDRPLGQQHDAIGLGARGERDQRK